MIIKCIKTKTYTPCNNRIDYKKGKVYKLIYKSDVKWIVAINEAGIKNDEFMIYPNKACWANAFEIPILQSYQLLKYIFL